MGAAGAAFDAIAPLGTMVAPAQTTSVRDDFTELDAEVSALGPPTGVVDSAIAAGTQRSLTQQVDATAAGLARLAAALVPFGTHQPAAYPS